MAEQTTEKIKVLALCDYACSTGFATVASNIMRELDKTGKFDLTIQGINFYGDQNYDPARFPGRLFTAIDYRRAMQGAGVDVYGLEKFKEMMFKGDYDVVFVLQDTFIAQRLMMDVDTRGISGLPKVIKQMIHQPKTMLYFPIDAPPSPDWIKEAAALFDYPVPYTGYAAEETLKVMPEMTHLRRPIYHGTNIDEFNYIEDREAVEKFKYEWFNRGFVKDHYVLLNVNRNQPRKDILSNLQVMKCLRDLGDTDTLLYLHMRYDDAGGNIIRQAIQLGLEMGKDVIVPDWEALQRNYGIDINQGIDVATMNFIYNSADAVISTTHGEGWGLSITEAFSTKTPVIAPNNTSLTEMGADNRAILVDSGDNYNNWNWQQQDNDRIRPTVNVEKMAKAILELKAGKRVPDIEGAYQWARKHSWENICKEWVDLFLEAGMAAKADTQRRMAEARKAQLVAGKVKPANHTSKKDRKRERQNKKAARK